MTLTSGTKLGPYEIQSPLGAGGMGEVYRARDTRLDRTVATDTFSYSGDGSRFLVNRCLKPDHVDPLTIVLHATAEAPR